MPLAPSNFTRFRALVAPTAPVTVVSPSTTNLPALATVLFIAPLKLAPSARVMVPSLSAKSAVIILLLPTPLNLILPAAVKFRVLTSPESITLVKVVSPVPA